MSQTSKAGTTSYVYEDDQMVKMIDVYGYTTSFVYSDDLLVSETDKMVPFITPTILMTIC